MLRQTVSIVIAALLVACVPKSTYDKEVGFYNTERQLNAQLETEIQADQVKIQRMQDRLRVTVLDELLFPEGGWQVSTRGKAVLDKMAPTLQSVSAEHRIEVEGYTDNVPIGRHLKHRFASNWELSTARATEVVKYLQQKGIDPSRMTAAGHGEYEPVASNDTPEGRQQNRRTEIDLVPTYTQ